jgi:cobalt/nickel transport system permease protein
VHSGSRVHALAPTCKIVATLLFVVAVTATPGRTVWPFPAYLLLLVSVAAAGRVPASFVGRRLAFEAPFVLFALMLPFTGGGEHVDLGPLSLSVDGLWAAWTVLGKAMLGVIATILLAATTPVPALLRGLEALRVPRAFTSVAAFMFRYADLITGEAHRMRIARQSRAYDPRWLWHARAVASAAGTLFLRSFERGERVYVAMLARGFDGSLPRGSIAARRSEWAAALTLPAAAAAIAALAWT